MSAFPSYGEVQIIRMLLLSSDDLVAQLASHLYGHSFIANLGSDSSSKKKLHMRLRWHLN
jgi:hypothetical protein